MSDKTNCPECFSEKQSAIQSKSNIFQVEILCKEKDYILLTDNIKNCDDEVKFICNKHKEYGFELADKESLDKAYPLWIAYLYADSKNPLEDISARLMADGTNGKYTAEYIVGLIEHTNSLMLGKNEDEKKDFYMSSISGILGKDERFSKKERESIEI